MANALMHALASNLRRLRSSVTPKVAQGVLADHAGIHRNTIARIELGELDTVDLATLQALAHGLTMTIGRTVEIQELLAPLEDSKSREVQESLEKFLGSGIAVASKVSPEEVKQLRKAVWPWGPPTELAWYHLLQALRAYGGGK